MKDLEKEYDAEIAPLMAQIIAVCKKYEMPVFATFRFSDDGRCTTSQPFGDEKVEACYDLMFKPRRPLVMTETKADGSKVISHIY